MKKLLVFLSLIFSLFPAPVWAGGEEYREVTCTWSPCEVLGKHRTFEPSATPVWVIRDGQPYRIHQDWARVSPNVLGYEGYGPGQYSWPTAVRLPYGRKIEVPAMGLKWQGNWAEPALQASKPGSAFGLETAYSLQSETKVSYTSRDFYRLANDSRLLDPWNFETTGVLRNGDMEFHITWNFIPRVEGRYLVLHIYSVEVTALIPSRMPEFVEGIGWDEAPPEAYGDWLEGETVRFERSWVQARELYIEDLEVEAYYLYVAAVELKRKSGQTVFLTRFYLDSSCESWQEDRLMNSQGVKGQRLTVVNGTGYLRLSCNN